MKLQMLKKVRLKTQLVVCTLSLQILNFYKDLKSFIFQPLWLAPAAERLPVISKKEKKTLKVEKHTDTTFHSIGMCARWPVENGDG